MDSSSGLLSLKWNNHTSTFTGVLSHLRDNNLYADAALACEGKVFSVHKLVLSTCSEYFQKIFEETDCRRPVIVLKDIKCSELDALLSYMYLGEVNVLQTDLSGLIKAAECLQVKGLAVADDVPLPKSTSSKQDSSKTGKRLSSSINASSAKRTRRERGRHLSSDEEDLTEAEKRSKTNSKTEECNEASNLTTNSNSKCSGNPRTSRKPSQEIVLDDDIKSEVLSPKLEEEMEYSGENLMFDDNSETAVLTSEKATHPNSTQNQDAVQPEGSSRPGQSCTQQGSHDELSSNSADASPSTGPFLEPSLLPRDSTEKLEPKTQRRHAWLQTLKKGTDQYSQDGRQSLEKGVDFDRQESTRQRDGHVTDQCRVDGAKRSANSGDAELAEVIDAASAVEEISSASLAWLEQSVNSREESNYAACLNQLLNTTNLQPFTIGNESSSLASVSEASRSSFLSPSSRSVNAASGNASSVPYLTNFSHPSSIGFFDQVTTPSALSVAEEYSTVYEAGSHVCTVCSKPFIQRCLLKRHMKIHDVGEKCKCHFCPFETTFKFNLKSHMARKHQHFCGPPCQLATSSQ